MWKLLQNSIPLFIEFKKEDGYEILITDFVHLWSNKFTKLNFISCLKESNKCITLFKDDVKFLERGVNLLSNPEQMDPVKATKRDDGNMFVSLSKAMGFNFKLDCVLIKRSAEYFFQHVTQPLLKTVKSLHQNESKLQGLLLDKDKEISKYKSQNVDVRFSVRTEVFDTEMYKKTDNTYEVVFGENEIPEPLINRVIETPEEIAVKQEVSTEEQTNTNHINESESNLLAITSTETGKQETIKTKSLSNVNTTPKKKKRLNY